MRSRCRGGPPIREVTRLESIDEQSGVCRGCQVLSSLRSMLIGGIEQDVARCQNEDGCERSCDLPTGARDSKPEAASRGDLNISPCNALQDLARLPELPPTPGAQQKVVAGCTRLSPAQRAVHEPRKQWTSLVTGKRGGSGLVIFHDDGGRWGRALQRVGRQSSGFVTRPLSPRRASKAFSRHR
jgi:hypothetical protein